VRAVFERTAMQREEEEELLLYSVFTALHIIQENSVDIIGNLPETTAVSILR
jgi:hypothetical protein